MTFIQVFQQVVFYIFAVGAVATALMVVLTRNAVKAVLYLVLTFLAMACIWIFLQAEFLALILVVVYVGAVMTLFLFVVMMLNVEADKRRQVLVRYVPIGIALIVLILIMMIFVVGPGNFGLQQVAAPAAVSADYSNVAALGMVLYSAYVLPFVVAGVLLLVAMVAAITLAFRGKKRRRQQAVSEQLKVTKADRLRIVKMHTEKKS